MKDTKKSLEFMFNLNPVLAGILIFAFGFQSKQVKADDVLEFDSTFLQIKNKQSVDLNRFSTGANLPPGEYKANLYLNNRFLNSSKVTLYDDNGVTKACITKSIVDNLNINFDLAPAALSYALKNDKCINLESLIPNASAVFDSSDYRLDLSIPQYYLEYSPRGYVDYSEWENGIPAVLLTYSLSGYNSESYGVSNNSFFASHGTSINYEGWNFKQNGTYTWSETAGGSYSSLNAYIQKDIPEWQGRIKVGQNNTSGQLFDTLPFTGFSFSTDDRMLPNSQRGYAPEIRGVAKTTARVVVRQNDRIIYETTVSPGPFLINDLYPTGFGGDLNVTVEESDGSQQNFAVPYTSMAQLLRPDAKQFSVVLGQYKDAGLSYSPMFLQAEYRQGLTNNFTGYSGLQLNQNYYSFQTGVAFGTFLGAFSADITHASAELLSRRSSGESFQLRYSKNVTSTGSNLSLAAYKYSTSGYMDLQTAMRAREIEIQGGESFSIPRTKNRFVLTASQRLGSNFGQLYISSSVEDYWGESGNSNQYQIGYSNRYKHISWGINANKSVDRFGEDQVNYQLNINVPLGFHNYGGPNLRASLIENDGGFSSQQVGLSDTFGEENEFSYGATLTRNNNSGLSGDASFGYVSPSTSFNSSLSIGEDYRSTSMGLSGSILAHKEGVTFSPYSSSTVALVKAEGASGAKVSGYSRAKVDDNGFAIVPSLNPYQVNTIEIDPVNISKHIELKNTSEQVVPIDSAVAFVEFETKRGIPLLIYSSMGQGAIPFSAEVYASSGELLGYVGQGGQIFVRVEPVSDILTVKWGNTATDSCTIKYSLDESSLDDTINRLDLACKEGE